MPTRFDHLFHTALQEQFAAARITENLSVPQGVVNAHMQILPEIVQGTAQEKLEWIYHFAPVSREVDTKTDPETIIQMFSRAGHVPALEGKPLELPEERSRQLVNHALHELKERGEIFAETEGLSRHMAETLERIARGPAKGAAPGENDRNKGRGYN